MMNMMVWMIFFFVIMYVFMIRPQVKKQKELATKIASLKTGDRVITSGGIHGVVTNVKNGASLTLRVADNVKIEVEKTAITTIVPPAEGKASEAKS